MTASCDIHAGEPFARRCRACDTARIAEERRHARPQPRAEIRNLRDVLLAGELADPAMAPHVRLAAHLPKDDLAAAWTQQALIDLLVADLTEVRE